MIAVRRAAVNAGAATPTLSFTQWRGREYLRIETERGVFFHDGEKSLLREKGFAELSPADISEPGPVVHAEMQELHQTPRLFGEPNAPEPGGEQPEDDDPSPGW